MNYSQPAGYRRRRLVYTEDSRSNPTSSLLQDDYAVGLGVNMKSGSSNPGYKYAIQHRENASSAYKMYRHFNVNPMFATCETFLQGAGYTIKSKANAVTLGNGPECSETHDAALKDEALSKLRYWLGTHIPYMDAVVPLVELREIRTMVKSMVHTTLDFVDAFDKVSRPSRNERYRRINSRLSVRKSDHRLTLRTLSDMWLSYSFGMKPMIADLKAALSVLSSRLDQPRMVRVTGTASKAYKETVSVGDTSFGMAVGSTFAVSRTDDVRLVYRFTGGWEVNPLTGNTYSLSDQFGLRLGANLVPTFWELVPFSWVIDYFTTVGDFFSDTFSVALPKPVYLVLSRKCERTAHFTGTISAQPGFELKESSCTDGSFQLVEFEREVLPTIPSRSLRFKTVDEVGINGVNKLLNLASVLLSSGPREVIYDYRYDIAPDRGRRRRVHVTNVDAFR